MTEWADAARLALAFVGLVVASRSDLKSRTVPDSLWYGLGAAALALMAADFTFTFGGMSWVLVVAVATVFVLGVTGGELISIFPGKEPPEENVELTPAQARIARIDMVLSAVLLAAAVAIFLAAPRLDLGARSDYLTGPEALAFSTCLMVGAGLFFYMLGVLHGGADAKGFMVLAVLFPAAPLVGGLPWFAPPALNVELIPFVVALYFNAALLQLLGSIPVFIGLSAARGRLKFPESFFGYEKPIAQVNPDRDFLLGHVVDGQWKRKLFTTRRSGGDAQQKESLDFLMARGERKVFVTPKVPFMVFMLAGLAAAVLVSSPLYWA